MVALPRFVIAAPASGQGKTTISVGIMAALRARGLAVAPFKVGPDFIDPGYHALATGRAGRNLDPWLTSEELIPQLLVHGSSTPNPADVSVIEGVMGLFDGRLGTDGFASTAHIARLTSSPVVLVADISSASRTLAASLSGMRSFDGDVHVAGVILNKSGSMRHYTEVARSCEQIGLPVLGHLPRDAGVSVPSRHLGLVPAAERDTARATLERLGSQIAEHVDLDALMEVAQSASDLDAEAWTPRPCRFSSTNHGVTTASTSRASATAPVPPNATPPRESDCESPIRVAVAGGRAFTFRYAETDELMRANGLEPVIFDPIRDRALPEGVSGIYLGGGFPEVHAASLASNTSLLASVRAAVASGMPTVAECAGMLYLLEVLGGRSFAGVVPAAAAMTPRLTLGYRQATTSVPTLLAEPGETITGHEFHRTATSPGAGDTPAWTLHADGKSWPEGFSLASIAGGAPNVHASYLHTHWAGHPHLATRFADAVRSYAATPARAGLRSTAPQDRAQTEKLHTDQVPPQEAEPSAPQVMASATEPDLNFHGDNETSDDVEDFAVNVRSIAPSRWMQQLLSDELRTLGRYPDATSATEAVAGQHRVGLRNVLVTNGASEAFTLIARAFSDRNWGIVHPQFTEPEAAARSAGAKVTHIVLDVVGREPLTPAHVPEECEVVVVGNPTNPTGQLHPAEVLRTLRRPGRVVVVDEAFMDAAGETESLLRADHTTGRGCDRRSSDTGSSGSHSCASVQSADGNSITGDGVAEKAGCQDDLDGLLIVRSMTKTHSLAGLRAGYLVGDANLIEACRSAQPHWSVNSLAAAAIVATTTPVARKEAATWHEDVALWRHHLVGGLEALGLHPLRSVAPFVTVQVGSGVREALRDKGFAVRRGETFPGLDASWVRIAVREPAITDALLRALGDVLNGAAAVPDLRADVLDGRNDVAGARSNVIEASSEVRHEA